MTPLAQVGNFSWLGVRLALAVLVGLFVGMTARELARAWAAARLGDPTPKLWGRLTARPSAWFDPFGSGLVPGLIAVLWAAGAPWIPVAYGKPPPIDPSYFRSHRRDVVVTSLVGPAATFVLAVVAGLALRVAAGSLPFDAELFLRAFAYACSGLTVFHLLPIPGLDGARVVALLLPPQAAQMYRNADRYLALFVLVLLFLLGSGVLSALTDAVCDLAVGGQCV